MSPHTHTHTGAPVMVQSYVNLTVHSMTRVYLVEIILNTGKKGGTFPSFTGSTISQVFFCVKGSETKVLGGKFSVYFQYLPLVPYNLHNLVSLK